MLLDYLRTANADITIITTIIRLFRVLSGNTIMLDFRSTEAHSLDIMSQFADSLQHKIRAKKADV